MKVLRRLYSGRANFDFVAAWKRGATLSAALFLIAVGSLLLRGLELGIDFEGGGVWEVPAETTSIEAARDALRPFGLANARIQEVTDGTGNRLLRVRAGIDSIDASPEIATALADLAGVSTNDVNIQTVGPSWGDEITKEARNALIWFFLLIAGYITVRLEWKMAVGGLVAVAHDIAISVGFYSVFQIEVTPATVIAFLTILGYSLYDTIVVFDKVQANTPLVSTTNRLTYRGMVNMSENQVIMRSVNTTITSILPIISLLLVGSVILGAATLQEFSIALLVGLVSGTYSSIFVAAPVLALLKEREEVYADVRERLRSRLGEDPNDAVGASERPMTADRAPSRPARATRPQAKTREGSSATKAPPPGYQRTHPPRPRKKGKRR
ncbi:MAG: protein translocase subunit SecF [Actinomycetia bacterium]|nr:protein translocase subunit SecF [Actinomycetes bacterium]